MQPVCTLEGAQSMSCVLTIQTKKYGAITALDLLYEGRLVASLVSVGVYLRHVEFDGSIYVLKDSPSRIIYEIRVLFD